MTTEYLRKEHNKDSELLDGIGKLSTVDALTLVHLSLSLLWSEPGSAQLHGLPSGWSCGLRGGSWAANGDSRTGLGQMLAQMFALVQSLVDPGGSGNQSLQLYGLLMRGKTVLNLF